jgi:multiple sugar transport system substrate-binding protein
MNRTVRRGVLARALVPVATAGLTAGLVVGCSGGGGGSTPAEDVDLTAVSDEDLQGTSIRLSRVFGDCEDTAGGVTDVAQATDECETIQILTNAFNADNEHGITVELLGGTESDGYYDSLNTAFSGGSAPDVALMHGSRIVDYAERNLLVPIDDALSVVDADLGDATEAARAAVTYQDQTYGLPFDTHAALVHLNVDLFAQAGLVDGQGKPIVPTSTQEFLDQAEKIKAATGKNYFGVARVNDGLGAHMWRSLVEQQGGSVVNEDLTEASVNTPEAIEALDFMNQVFEGGYAAPDQTYDAAQADFLNGETAMLMNGTWVVDQYTKEAPFTYQTADFPTLYDQASIWAESHTWVMPRQQEADPARQRAALEFISYLYDHSGDWAVHTGHLAARTSVLESPEYQQAPQRANYVATGTTNANLVPNVGNWAAVEDALVAQLDSIWFQGEDVESALDEADRQVNEIISE